MKLPNPEGFIAFEINYNEFINSYRKLSMNNCTNAVLNYLKICKTLLLSGNSFSDHIRDILIYSEQPLIEKYLRGGCDNEGIYNAICYDVKRIAELCSLSSKDIKKYLGQSFNRDFSDLPEFDLGKFNYDAEYFIESCKKNGSGILARYRAFSYISDKTPFLGGSYLENCLRPIERPDPIRLSDLKRYEIQKQMIVDNTKCLINNKPANNVLLYGDRGTGKSSTIKAMLGEFPSLRMIQLDKSQISAIFDLYGHLEKIPLHFIIFIDDLCFSEDDDNYIVLKQALDGSLSAKPDNILIYATTNRRHIIKETAANRADSYIHKSDAVDDNMSLSDRFGLFVTFTSPNKEQFVDIGLKIALDRGMKVDKEEFAAGLERFALKRSGRSPRIAKQYVDMLEGSISLGKDI